MTRVATSADEQIWLEVAESASGAQLQRICREYSRVLTPESDRKLESERGLCIGQRLDGLVTITARLLPEEAEIVFAALKKAEAQQRTPAAALADQPRSWDEREADALVEVCRQALASSALEPAGETPPSRVVVHVDSAVLAGDDDGGRCQGRFRLSAEAARGLACDGELQLQAERAGVPIDLGRARRVVSPQLARALRARDGGCRFPGCGRRRVHAHHLEHWAQGGRTDLGNLLSLCGFHHHRLHRGFYRVTGTAARPRFETHDGRLIGAAPPARGAPPAPTASPAVPEYQPRMQLAYAVGAIADGVTLAHRARPG